MHLRRIGTVVAIAGLATALVAPSATATSSTHHAAQPGTNSLASVLLADGDTFDHNWNDYDILTQAVLAVLAAKPDSPVKVLTDGTVPLTAFLPNDQAFRALASDLTKKSYGSESTVFNTLVSAVGVDAIESVLLYHVIPGATITSKQAKAANGAVLATALPDASVKVRVVSKAIPVIELRDNDRSDANPFLNPFALDINKGNLQIGHGILLVLRPIDL